MHDLSHIPRILVLEDEALIAMDLAQMLAEAGARSIASAATNAEALAALDELAIDAAVVDLHLGRDGSSYEVAGLLREKGIPFVFTSGSADVADGFRDVPLVGKPYKGDELLAVLIAAAERPEIIAAE